MSVSKSIFGSNKINSSIVVVVASTETDCPGGFAVLGMDLYKRCRFDPNETQVKMERLF